LMALLPKVAKGVEDGPSWLWMISAMGPFLMAVCVLIWWVFGSRAMGREKGIGVASVLLVGVAVFLGLHPTMKGPAIMVLTFPLGMAGFALGAVLVGRWQRGVRIWVMVGMAALGFGYSLLLRSDGFWGNFDHQRTWRWIPTSEAQLALKGEEERSPAPSSESIADFSGEAEWPGFRGPGREGHVFGHRYATDWEKTPPVLMWKIPVGPAWSSFAVHGSHLFTQEQRGEAEWVICYDADTGAEIWGTAIDGRFEDPVGGPGPRATPEVVDGKLYALGALGTLLCLDPGTGKPAWQVDISSAAKRKPPQWGFSSSPLVVEDLIIVHAGGEGILGTLAFERDSGRLRWSAPSGDHSYSSPQLARLEGEDLILMLTNDGLRALEPSSGKVTFAYSWKHNEYRALQVSVIGSDSLLLPTGVGAGTRRIRVEKLGTEWNIVERWTSRRLKPDFNDFVTDGKFAYGFDGSIFTCVDLDTGERAWKGGRYGTGQVLYLEEDRLLFVAGEYGQGVLLRATATGHEELANVPMLEGKTWNHPVIVRDRLYLRNAQEAACFRLP
ncbi:MAG: PQQ-binding-like beta-propeller repeat protein, partial [Verrucomicrobiota bacterium]